MRSWDWSMNTGVLNDYAQVANPFIVSWQAEIVLADAANSLNLTNSNQHQYIHLYLPPSQIKQMISFQTQIHWMWQAVTGPLRFKRDRKMLQRCYGTTQKELLAIVRFTRHFWHYFHHTHRPQRTYLATKLQEALV